MTLNEETFKNKILIRKSFDSRSEVIGIPSMPFTFACAIGGAGFFFINPVYGLLLALLLVGVLYVLYQVDPDFLKIAQDKMKSDAKSIYRSSDEFKFTIFYL